MVNRGPMTGYIDPHYTSRVEDLRIIEGILYILRVNKSGEPEAGVVIPGTLVEEALHRAHGDYYAGHPSENRTYNRIYKFCTWPTIRRDTKAKVKGCPECQAARPGGSKAIPVKPQTVLYPLHYVQADLLQFQTTSHRWRSPRAIHTHI